MGRSRDAAEQEDTRPSAVRLAAGHCFDRPGRDSDRRRRGECPRRRAGTRVRVLARGSVDGIEAESLDDWLTF